MTERPQPPLPMPVLDSETSSEWSYGLIPIRIIPSATSSALELTPPKPTTSNTQVLLIKQHPHPFSAAKGYKPFWSFPKGHPEKYDASPLQTAIREVSEETGLYVEENDILFLNAEPLIERFRNPIRLWVKEVRYWVAIVDASRSEVTLQEKELAASKWCDWDEAEGLLTFERGSKILQRVRALLDGEGDGEKNKGGGEGVKL